MFAADTNVLIRLLVGDDKAQQRAVVRRFEALERAGDAVLITPVVLAELSWVLATSYRFDRGEIASAIRGLLGAPFFVVAARTDIEQAIGWFEAGGIEFADALILADALSRGATRLLTFDRKLLARPETERP